MSLYTKILNNSINKYASRIVLVCDAEKYTYGQLDERVRFLAGELNARGVKKNSKVVIKIKNPLKFTLTLLAVLYLEAIPAPIYAGFAEEKTLIMSKEYQVNFVISHERLSLFAEFESDDLIDIGIVYKVFEEIDETLNGVSILLSTSGTTSKPKEIMLTEDNICSNVKGISEYLKLNENDRILIIKDLSHSSSIIGELLVALYNGCMVVYTTKLCQAVTMLTLMQKYSITVFFAVPTLLKELMVCNRLKNYNISALRIVNFYGAAMNADDILKLTTVFSDANVIYSYGQTEASPRVTYIEKDKILTHPGSSGKPIKDVSIKIIDEKTGCECAPFVRGEIVVQGPNVMRGYYRDEERTKRVLKNRNLYTGDIAYLDEEGFLYVTGRKDNMFVRAGKNIYPEEIEGVLMNYDGILEALVIPFKREGDSIDILAYVVVDCSKGLDMTDLVKWCRLKLEDYKLPRDIFVVSQLEKTPSGKIKRNV